MPSQLPAHTMQAVPKNFTPIKITNTTDFNKYFTTTNSSTSISQTWKNEELTIKSTVTSSQTCTFTAKQDVSISFKIIFYPSTTDSGDIVMKINNLEKFTYHGALMRSSYIQDYLDCNYALKQNETINFIFTTRNTTCSLTKIFINGATTAFTPMVLTNNSSIPQEVSEVYFATDEETVRKIYPGVCRYTITGYNHRGSDETEYIQCSWYENGNYQEITPIIPADSSELRFSIPRGATDISWHAQDANPTGYTSRLQPCLRPKTMQGDLKTQCTIIREPKNYLITIACDANTEWFSVTEVRNGSGQKLASNNSYAESQVTSYSKAIPYDYSFIIITKPKDEIWYTSKQITHKVAGHATLTASCNKNVDTVSCSFTPTGFTPSGYFSISYTTDISPHMLSSGYYRYYSSPMTIPLDIPKSATKFTVTNIYYKLNTSSSTLVSYNASPNQAFVEGAYSGNAVSLGSVRFNKR